MSDINKIIDSLGRTITGLGGDIESLTSQIKSASTAMGKAVKYIQNQTSPPKESKDEITQKLLDSISSLDSKIKEQIEEHKKTIDSIEDLSSQINNQKKNANSKLKEEISSEQKLTNALESAAKKIEEVGNKFEDSSASLMKALGSRKMDGSGVENAGGGGGRGGGGGGGINMPIPDPDDFKDIGEEGAKNFVKGFEALSKSKMASYLTEISTILIGGYGDIGQVLFAGSIRDAVEFRKEARRIAFEVEGISSSTRGLQAQFVEFKDIAKQTGKALDVIQRLYLSNMRKGFKRQGEELKKILKSGMYLSTMIGSNVDETGAMFADWNRMLGMTTGMMSQMASDAKQIARETGVTGDELVAVMRSSEAILKNLINQANLTSNASKNVISAMAMAKKLGIEDQMSGILDMLSSTNKFLQGDDKNRNFILSMLGNTQGGIDAAMTGTALDDKDMLKSMMKEMNNVIFRITSGAAKTVEDFDKLNKDQKKDLSLFLQSAYGQEMGEYRKIYLSFEESSKSLGEKFKELSKEATNANESLENRRLAEQKTTDLLLSNGMRFANRYAEEIRKSGVELNDAMNKVNSSFSQQDKDEMSVLFEKGNVGKTGDPMTNFKNSLMLSAEQMKKTVSDLNLDVDLEDFSKDISKASSSEDFVSIVDAMNKASKEIDIAVKKGNDPIDALTQSTIELNEGIRDSLAPKIGKLIDILGWQGLALAQVGIALGIFYSRFGDLTDKITNRFSSIINMVAGGFEKANYSVGKISLTKPIVPTLETSNYFSRFANKASDLIGGIADVFEGNFNGIRKSVSGFFDVLRKRISGFFDVFSASFDFLFGRLRKISFGSIVFDLFNMQKRFLNLKPSIQGIGGAMMFLIKLPFKATSLSLRQFQKGLKGLGGILKKTPVIGWLFMAVDGVIGAVEGYKKAGDIFGAKAEELTDGMKMSAGAAGATVGVLDGLTFGLLRITGVADTLTAIFSKLYYGFTYLADGVKQGFTEWLPDIQESFSSLGQALGELWSMFAGIFGYDIKNEGDGWKAFYEIMGTIGKVIGSVVGGALKLFVDILYAIVQVIKGVVWYINVWIGGIKALWKAITTLSFEPIIEYFSKIGTDILNALDKVFSDLGSWISSWFSWLPWGKKTAPPSPSPQVALAEGGITKGPTNALIGEAGPEAVIPLDKLDKVVEPNRVQNIDFTKTKSLQEQQKNNDLSMKSNNVLDNLYKLASTSSNGLYVKDLKTYTMLQLLFNKMGYIYETIDAIFNFMSKDDSLAAKKAKATAKLNRLDVTTQIIGQDKYKNIVAEMQDDVLMSLSRAMTGKALEGIEDKTFEKNYSKRFSEIEQKEVVILLKKIEEAVSKGKERGSFYTHDIHMVSEVGDLTNTVKEKIPKPLETPKIPEQKPSDVAVVENKLTEEQIADSNLRNLSGYSGTPDPALSQNWTNTPEFMWDAKDQADHLMHQQRKSLNSTSSFEESAAWASTKGWAERGDSKIESLMKKASSKLEREAREAYLKDKKEELELLDSKITQLNKKVLEEFSPPTGRRRHLIGKQRSISDMPSYDALQKAYKERDEIRLGKVPDKYVLENTMMGGENPNMLYETKDEAISRAKGEKEKRILGEKDNIKALEEKLAKLKEDYSSSRKDLHRAPLRGPEANEINKKMESLEQQIADIEGNSSHWFKSYGAQGTHGLIYDGGQLEAARSRLEAAEKFTPENAERQVVGKKVWSGDSDTSVVFPSENINEATDYHLRTKNQTMIEPSSSPEVLEQNIEQNKKLGTMEKSAAQSLEPGSIYTHDIHLEKLLLNLLGDEKSLTAAKLTAEAIERSSLQKSTPVGQHAIPVVRTDSEEEVSNVQPVHLRDVAEAILRDKTSGNAGTNKLQSDELTRMEEVANKQYTEMQQIREGIQEMVRLLKPSPNQVGATEEKNMRTKFFSNRVKPSVFGQIKDGRPGSGPNRGVYQ